MSSIPWPGSTDSIETGLSSTKWKTKYQEKSTSLVCSHSALLIKGFTSKFHVCDPDWKRPVDAQRSHQERSGYLV